MTARVLLRGSSFWVAFSLGVAIGCAKKPPEPVAEAPPAVEIAPAEVVPPAPPAPVPNVPPVPPRPAPAGTAEAMNLLKTKEAAALRQHQRQLVREGLCAPFFFNVPGVAGVTTHHFAIFGVGALGGFQFAPNETTDPEAAADADTVRIAPLQAMRAARGAIAENPDHPDPYYALAQVLRDADLPLTASERALGIAIACRQCLDRLPPPGKYRRGQFVAIPSEVALQLASLYLNSLSLWDPRAGQEKITFLGMPIDVAPLNELLGQAVFEDERGRQERVGFDVLRSARIPPGFKLLTGDTPHFLPLDTAFEILKLALAYAPIDSTGNPEEQLKDRIQRIEKLLKEVEKAVLLSSDQYQRTADQGVPVRVQVALRVGLTQEALRLLTDKSTDLAKEYNDQLPYAMFLRVGLGMALGRIENATSFLKDLDTPESVAMLERAGLTSPVHRLKYVKALLVGEYKTAGELWEGLAGNALKALDNIPPPGPTVPLPLVVGTVGRAFGRNTKQEAEDALKALLRPPLMSLMPGTPLTQPLTLEVWQGTWFNLTQLLRQQIAGQLQMESNFFYGRGVLFLLEGDLPAAKQRFRQATRKAPKGWNLPDFIHPDAIGYLRLIENAQKKAAAP